MRRDPRTEKPAPDASNHTEASAPTVFVVDDDPAIREWIQATAESVGLKVASYANAIDFLASYVPDTAGCLLLDVRLPRMSGLELQHELRERNITLPVIMMSAFGEVPMVARAMRDGAFDFLEKPFHAQDLLDRLHQAIAVDTRKRQHLRLQALTRARLSSLTERESEVLEQILSGAPNKVIAANLGISEKTVEVRRAHLMEKMQAGSLAELIQAVLLARQENP